MKSSLCEAIKSRISLRNAAALFQIEFPPDGKEFRSMLRPDRKAGCSVKGDLFSDWSTGEHLDQIDFYGAGKGISRMEAIHELARLCRIIGDTRGSVAEPKFKKDQDVRAEKARKRMGWPAFSPPTADQIREIAKLRGISAEGVQIAADRGLLFTATDRGAEAWAVTDSARLNARIRRMDGGLWYGENKSMPPTGGGQESSWPVGIPEAQSFPAIAVVEGEADILAALHLAWCANVEEGLAVVGMLGSGERISEEALPLFRGKRVRIFEDNDSAGERAASRWTQQLFASGTTVDVFSFSGLIRADGAPVKDMTDFAHLDPDQWEKERERVESAFNFVQTAQCDSKKGNQ
jgi:hypothetical protein